jgi:uncharacterized protein YebE (UPF0316 family)
MFNLENPTFFYIILPLLIFLSRIFDVSLGTLRIIFVAKGMKFIAPIIGFFEVLIWLIVMGQIMNNLTNPVNYIAYAGGFAAGNFVGIYIEGKLAMGIMLLRIITKKSANELIQFFRAGDYQVTNIPAETKEGSVQIIFLPIRRKELPLVIEVIQKYNPNALYTIEDVRMVSGTALPVQQDLKRKRLGAAANYVNRFRRKGK